MESIVGIFNSLADAKRAAAILQSLGIPEDKVSVFSPHTSETDIEAEVSTSEAEQPGMGSAVGGTVGAALGVAGGASAGAAVATFMIPGVGPVLALGLIGAALFGVGGAAAGALAGGALEKAIDDGLPRDEVYVYEDALRRGRSLVIAFADDEQIAENARAELKRDGAETVDAAREEWWIGLRGAEQEHYTSQGGDFKVDEAKYRLGFEAALHPDWRGKSSDDLAANLRREYGDTSTTRAFRQGYDRGQNYHVYIVESHQPGRPKERSSKSAA